MVVARRKAASLVAIAQRLEARMSGQVLGRKRASDFTDEEAKRLLTALGSLNAVASALGVSRQTVQRAVLPVEQWPPSVRARNGHTA